MHLRLASAASALVTVLATVALAQSTTNSTSNTSASPAQSAPPATPSTPPVAPPATAPAAATSSPPVAAPNTVVQPDTRPVVPPTSNSPQPPSTPVNPLAPTPSNPSNAAQTIVNSTTTTPGAVNAAALVAEPRNLNELAAAGVDVSLNPTAALTTVRQAPVANQQIALRSLQTRIDATSRALTDLRAQARANGVAGAGTNFDQAAEEVRVREVALRDAISAAGGTADEAAWRQSQTQLATLYQAYADAVQRARALLQPTPTQP
jgi:hypothetical protein